MQAALLVQQINKSYEGSLLCTCPMEPSLCTLIIPSGTCSNTEIIPIYFQEYRKK